MPKRAVEFYLSIVAIVISFCTALFSFWQIEATRQHNRISVRPLIVITPYAEGPNGRTGVYIGNQGLGPATIRSFCVKVDGKTFCGLGKNKWAEVLRKAGSEPLCFQSGWPNKGSILKVGEEEVLLAPTVSDLPFCNAGAALLLLMKDIEITIGYESLYGEKYIAEGSAKINIELP